MLCGHVISSKFVGIAMMALMLPSSTHSFMQRRTPTAAALASSSSLWKTARPTTEVEAEDDNNSNQSTPQNRREVFQSIPGRVAAFSAIAATAGGITVPATAAAAAAASPTTATATTTTTTAAPTFSYGPLEEFVGTWKGSNGFVMIAVPSPGTEPTDRYVHFSNRIEYNTKASDSEEGSNLASSSPLTHSLSLSHSHTNCVIEEIFSLKNLGTVKHSLLKRSAIMYYRYVRKNRN